MHIAAALELLSHESMIIFSRTTRDIFHYLSAQKNEESDLGTQLILVGNIIDNIRIVCFITQYLRDRDFKRLKNIKGI